MSDFIKSFESYYRTAQFGSVLFWVFPVGTVLVIWLLTVAGAKVFARKKGIKSVFFINRLWIINSLAVAGVIIGLICFWWTKNYFSQNPIQLSLLISLIIAMLIPILCMLNLRQYYTQDKLKEITDQPKTLNQLDSAIVFTKKLFGNNKFYYLLPLIGFLFLLLYLYKGTNLIVIAYDNSASMQTANATEAITETFSSLDDNNEIILTTVDGYQLSDKATAITTLNGIMAIKKSSGIKGGNVTSFANPTDAKAGVSQIANLAIGSPICESIWKTYLYITETKANEKYANKLLIVITDGDDYYVEPSLASGKFFFDDENFAAYFPTDKVFIIDYSNGKPNPFMQRFSNANVEIFPAENNKQAYLDGLDNALNSFKVNWFLIYWTISLFALLAIIGLLIQPKKIV